MPDTRERQAAIRLHAPRRRVGARVLFARLAVPTLTHGTLGRPSEVRSGDWGLQKLPRGVLAAAPRACVASPPARASPAPFSTQILPAGSSSSTPHPREAPPTLPAAPASSSRPSPFFLFFHLRFYSGKPPGTRTSFGRLPKTIARVRSVQGKWRRKATGGLDGLPSGAWRRLAPTRLLAKRSVPRAVRQRSGQLERLLVTLKDRAGLASAGSPGCH
ncbi:hypothetical protein NN561_003410 [Cricetulus griseus]